MGRAGRVDINLNYSLKNFKTEKVLFEKSESIALDTKTSKTLVFFVPRNVQEGRYKLDVQANYKNKFAKASTSLYVLEPPPTFDKNNLKSRKNDKQLKKDTASIDAEIITATDNRTKEEKEKKISKPINSINIEQKKSNSNYADILNSAIGLITKSIDSSLKECTKLKHSVKIDDCYDIVARISKKKYICDNIKQQSTKELCLWTIIALNKGNCKDIKDSVLQQTCNSYQLTTSS